MTIPIDSELNVSMTELINNGILTYTDEIGERSNYASGQKKLASVC